MHAADSIILYLPIFLCQNKNTGVQFHPEKNGYDFRPDFVYHRVTTERKVCHDADAIMALQSLADFFMEEAKKSHHVFDAEAKNLKEHYKYSLEIRDTHFC